MPNGDFVLPTRPTPLQLRDEFYRQGQPNFDQIRERFQVVHGPIIDEYYAADTPAAAILVRTTREHRVLGFSWTAVGPSKLQISYSSAAANPSFAAALRSARQEEHKNSALLRRRAQEIFAQTIYIVIVHLLGILDLIASAQRSGALDEKQQEDRLRQEAEAADKDINQAKAFAAGSVRSSAVSFYTLGLLPGVVLVTLLLLCLQLVPATFMGATAADTARLTVCLASGAIGATVSVMVRITKNGNLDVAIDRTRWMTSLGGAFRPVVGAIFGAAFFVLIKGSLIPLKDAGANDAFYFTGLAFLAGFSERWAQDTIVQSTPSSSTSSGGTP
ncbi:hypothetical protein AB5J62_26905 [Amycolatopsis sp. cg5]|uniref:hypothetical protein n=1 Tax=Amycolatopsis sp. cg5 TaxID=3238802 RepID=UPI0035246573